MQAITCQHIIIHLMLIMFRNCMLLFFTSKFRFMSLQLILQQTAVHLILSIHLQLHDKQTPSSGVYQNINKGPDGEVFPHFVTLTLTQF